MDNCIKNHKFDDILIHEFIKNQKKYLENIKCSICNNDKNLYNNYFYICSCGKNICKLCLENHKIENHNIIEYDKRYNICIYHKKEFISYCKDCKTNLCEKCEKKHYKHKIIIYKMIINKIKIKEMKNKLNDNNEKINEFKEEIDKLKEIFNNFIINLKNDLEDYINLINIILYCLDNLYNYETIINVINFKLESLNSDINNFLNKNIKNKIKIFGSKFVEKNKKKINIIINNKIFELNQKYKIKKKDKIKKIKIKLLVNKK